MALPGFTGRGARRHVRSWMAAVRRAQAEPETALPAASGAGRRWPAAGPPVARA